MQEVSAKAKKALDFSRAFSFRISRKSLFSEGQHHYRRDNQRTPGPARKAEILVP